MTTDKPIYLPTRTTLIKRAETLKDEIEQTFADITHWNSRHPNEPLDADPTGELKALWNALDEMLTKEERRTK